MNGIIGFEDFNVRCIIGVDNPERLSEQDLFIDLKVETDFTRATHTDSLQETLSYDYLAELCKNIAEEKKHALLETFAYDLIHRIIKDCPVRWVWVKIKKPGALPNAKFAFVELEWFFPAYHEK